MDKLRIRNALPSDHAAMLALTRDVWEGTDYIPFVWDEWLRDAAGRFMSAVLDGRLVGLQHIERQPDSTAWVEGIRVAADLRDRGIGGRLLEEAVLWARQNGCSGLRLAMSSGNPASNRLAERAGLRPLGTFASVQADPAPATRDGARVAGPADFGRVMDVLSSSSPRGSSHCVYTEGWTAYTLTASRLRLLLAMGSVVLAQDAVAIATTTAARPSLRIGLLRGREDNMAGIARWLCGRAVDLGVATVRANVESTAPVRSALESSGFHSRHGNSMCLHGLHLG